MRRLHGFLYGRGKGELDASGLRFRRKEISKGFFPLIVLGMAVVAMVLTGYGYTACAAGGPLEVSPSTLNLSGTPGQTVQATLNVSGGFPPYEATAEIGTLEPSFLESEGQVNYRYTIPATASPGTTIEDRIEVREVKGGVYGASVAVPVAIVVVAPLDVTPEELTLTGHPGDTVSGDINVSGGLAPYTFDTGIGQVSPDPLTVAGVAKYQYTLPQNAGGVLKDSITVVDAVSQTKRVEVTITVTVPPFVVVPSSLELTGLPGDEVSAELSVHGGVAPYQFTTTVGTLIPNPLEQPGSTTFRYQIPTTAMEGSVINGLISASDFQGDTERIPVKIVVRQKPVIEPDSLSLIGSPGATASGKINITGGLPPFTLSAKLGMLTPAVLNDLGEATYRYDVPGDTPQGSKITDSITVTDAQGTASEVPVTIAVDPLSGLEGLTPPERAVAGAIEKIYPTLLDPAKPLTPEQEDMRDRFSELMAAAQTNPDEVAAALSAIAPEEASAAGTLATEITNRQMNNIKSRIQALRGGATGISIKGISMNLDGQSVPLGALAQNALTNVSGGAASADNSELAGRFGIFVTGDFDFGSKDGTANESGFDFDISSVTAGMDYRVTDKFVLGGAFGYGNTDTDIDHNGGNLDSDAWNLSLYGLYNLNEHIWVNGIFSYAWNSYDSERHIAYDLSNAEPVDRNADADYDGTQYAFSISAGYDFYRNAFTFGAFGGLYYSRTDVDDYTESGASGLDLAVDDQTIESFTTTLGGKISYAISTSFGVLVPQLSVDWEHEFKDGDRTLDVRFVNDPGDVIFGIPTDSPDRDYFHVSPGISAVFPYGINAYLYYEATLGKDNLTENNITIGLRYEF